MTLAAVVTSFTLGAFVAGASTAPTATRAEPTTLNAHKDLPAAAVNAAPTCLVAELTGFFPANPGAEHVNVKSSKVEISQGASTNGGVLNVHLD